MSKTITYADFVVSVAAALQYISYYHPVDYIQHLAAAYEREASAAAKTAIGQILENSRMCAMGGRPVCQDTGIVNVFIRLGMDAKLSGFESGLVEALNDGIRAAYLDPANTLRASIVRDPLFTRENTRDNTPAVVHIESVKGSEVEICVMAKGGGAENKSVFATLMPSDSITDWVLKQVPKMGAGWCPPGMLGIGVGGTAEMAMLLAKKSLTKPIDMYTLQQRGPVNKLEELRLELYERINALGIGAQGLGGLTTVLDVKIETYPSHAASKPVAVIPNCAATRHATFTLKGEGPVYLDPPPLEIWPQISSKSADQNVRRVSLENITRSDIASWKAGETLLLSGKLLTGRDAAHKRLAEMMNRGESLPVDFHNRFLYYVGPVDPVRDEVVGPCGPTTSTRMDKFTPAMLEKTGLLGMIGKAERGAAVVDAIERFKSVYMVATGGAAYLISKSVMHSKVVAFEDLGMEAIYEFDVVDMPVTVAVDSQGNNVHESGPRKWRIYQT